MTQRLAGVVLVAAFCGSPSWLCAQAASAQVSNSSVAPKVVEVTPGEAEGEVGQQLKFTALAKDASGQTLPGKPSLWFAAPFDLAGAEDGTVTLYEPGEVLVGAVIGGKTGYARIHVKPLPVAKIEIIAPTRPLVVGESLMLEAVARTSTGNPNADTEVTWTSQTPALATVDAAGVVRARSPGTAKISASSGQSSFSIPLQVVKNDIRSLAVEPNVVKTRTGDVVHFVARVRQATGGIAKDPSVNWEISGAGAEIYPDGAFVAELPGTYVVTAGSGAVRSTASVVVSPRNAERELEVVAHIPVHDVQAAEQWIIGKYAYLSSVADKVWAYDISDPANPKLADTLTVDARLVNDVSTTPDGRIGVITREGASTRKNGIVFLDTSDPYHLKVLSEYTATVTGGVHSAYINSHYVYLTDDATGSMRVIDFQDPKSPREVARWQVEAPLAKTIEGALGPYSAGRFLHDLQVKDGIAYLAYWRDGLVILDVGNGIKGGAPEKPQFVSQLRFNHHELYGNGWLAGSHTVFRYKNYLFLGDEVFPAQFELQSKNRIPVRGILHVVDVSDLQHPIKVAEYAVPEAGAHNVWADNDVLYMGYYNGGGRVLDVSGELRGDLYRQGREIARLWTGDKDGFRSNLPFTWGAQPQNGMIFFNDINSGLWITRLGKPKYKGSTTAPPLP